MAFFTAAEIAILKQSTVRSALLVKLDFVSVARSISRCTALAGWRASASAVRLHQRGSRFHLRGCQQPPQTRRAARSTSSQWLFPRPMKSRGRLPPLRCNYSMMNGRPVLERLSRSPSVSCASRGLRELEFKEWMAQSSRSRLARRTSSIIGRCLLPEGTPTAINNHDPMAI